MLDIRGAVDAPCDYYLQLVKHRARACRNLKPRDPGKCFGANIIRYSDTNVDDVLVELTRTFIQFKDQPNPFKYVNSAEMSKIARINDLEGKRGMVALLRILEAFGEKKVRLIKPKGPNSYQQTRSDEWRARRKEYAASLKHKKHRRKYRTPQANGLRSGIGRSHSWEV